MNNMSVENNMPYVLCQAIFNKFPVSCYKHMSSNLSSSQSVKD